MMNTLLRKAWLIRISRCAECLRRLLSTVQKWIVPVGDRRREKTERGQVEMDRGSIALSGVSSGT